MALFRRKSTMPGTDTALPGRQTPLNVPETHFVNGHRVVPPFPAGMREAVFGLGCFWGAEKLFWKLPGVYSTAVGYAADLLRTPHTRRCAAVIPGTRRWCVSSTIRRRSPIRSC